MTHEALEELAAAHGLQTHSWDWKGNPVQAAPETVIEILKAMDVDASSDEAIARALDEAHAQPWRRPLPHCTVIQPGRPAWVYAHVPSGAPAALSITLENGGERNAVQVDNWTEDRLVDGNMVGEATFELPDDLPLGYHRLTLHSGDDLTAEASLVVSPECLGLPASAGERRLWGYSAQLYSVRSGGSWGVGDLQDLAELAAWAATKPRADFVLINPLHAAEPDAPLEPSPYLPSTRQFINPIYIRPESIPEYDDVTGAPRSRLRALRRRALALDRIDAIDRDTAWTLKKQALRIVFDAGLSPARRLALDAYRKSAGRGLHDFAVWSALSCRYGHDWRTWLPELRRPTSPAVDAFAAANADEVAFAEWCQWIAQAQLGDAHRVARQTGMRVGVITDLAVGASPRGADAWMLSDVYAHDTQVGAPPDAYNQRGQLWGQPPWRPDRLAELDFVPFRAVVRSALSHAGGVRMDHVMGMFRLWWVPEGFPPDQGCYVTYDHEALVGILALEAQRAGAFVVGEDLGTVEPWVREYLARRGILGTSVLWFEYDNDGHPLEPDRWRDCCLASVTTHDLPPTAGFLAMEHVRLRHRLGLLTEPLDVELDAAHAEQQWWLDYLAAHDLVCDVVDGVTVDPVEATVLGLHKAMMASPARVLSVALVDAVGDRRVQNQPGTIDEYPNWRVPLSGPDGHLVSLEQIFASPRPLRLAAVLNGWSHVPDPMPLPTEVHS